MTTPERPGSRRTPVWAGVTENGILIPALPTEAEKMGTPCRCESCDTLFDSDAVHVTARYADCSMWECPGCGRTHDSRQAWGRDPLRRMGYRELRTRQTRYSESRRRHTPTDPRSPA